MTLGAIFLCQFCMSVLGVRSCFPGIDDIVRSLLIVVVLLVRVLSYIELVVTLPHHI